MTDSERISVIEALEKSKLGGMAGFRIEIFHGFTDRNYGRIEYWDVVLYPMINCIYLIDDIMDVVFALDLHIAVFTDMNRPGCIIFH